MDEESNTMDLVLKISDILPNVVNQVIFNVNTKKFVVIIKKQKLEIFLHFLKKSSLFHIEQLQDFYCNDLLNLDFLTLNKRFQLNYILLSVSNGFRMHVKYNISNIDVVKSVSTFFKSSLWLEREVWDLYGVFILNNTDLRRILTDYGFKGFALRKDFPLYGYVEILYDIEYKCLVFNNVELMQEYRSFEFISPWNTK